ncbi:MAG: hypothetical protein ACHQF0_01750 [Chitinophagales bacterium]
MIRTAILIILMSIVVSCNHTTGSLTTKQISDVQDSVRVLTDSIAKNISLEGPVAWLRYFENSPDFFMAADGQLVFPNIDSAKNFITNTLVKTYRNIQLHWSNMRITPVTSQFALVGAGYHEDITYSDGKKLSTDGYFTGAAHQTDQGWKLQNAHWSSITTH